MSRIKVGDIFEIPLANGLKAYCQFVFFDNQQGPLVQVFDLISKEDVGLEDIQKAKPLFPPVITGLKAAVRIKIWKKIGNIPVKNFKYPLFISPFYDATKGNIAKWFLWDGGKYTDLGRELPSKYKDLTRLGSVAPQDLAKWIQKEMQKNN